MKRIGLVFGLAGVVLAGGGLFAADVALEEIVPAYIGAGLATAIIPTPKQARLAGVCVELKGPPVCVCPEVLVEAKSALDEAGIGGGREAPSGPVWRWWHGRW